MPATFYQNGIGEALGDSFVTGAPLVTTGTIWFVHAETGSNSNEGYEKRQPLATLAQAITNASAGDKIVLLDGHEETLTGAVTINKRLLIAGAGRSAGKPTVKFTPNLAAGNLFTISAAGVELRNLWIQENAQANSASRLDVTASLLRMVGCYVACNGNDNDYAININVASGIWEFKNTTFISTETDSTDAPMRALYITNSSTRGILDGVVFDGGEVGWDGGYAYEEAAEVTQLIVENLSTLRGADMLMHANTLGHAIPQLSSGGAYIDWTNGGA